MDRIEIVNKYCGGGTLPKVITEPSPDHGCNVITYKVNTGIVTNKSLSIPWFGEPGLGTQYRMNRTAKYLIGKKIITPIKKDPLFGK